MSPLRILRVPFAMLMWLVLCDPAPVAAQEAVYTLDQVTQLFRTQSPTGVLNLIRRGCIDFRADDPQAQQRLRQAGADDAFLEALRSLCYRAPPEPVPPASAGTPAVRLLSPGGAALRSLLVPGLGQLYSGRPAVGIAFLGAAAGALAFGALSESVTVLCTSGAGGACRPEHVVSEQPSSRLGLGIAGFVGVAALAALEAHAGTKRVNRARTAEQSARDEGSGGLSMSAPAIRPTLTGLRIELVRLHF